MTGSHPIAPLALRDTALIVSELADGATTAQGFSSFRQTCQGLLARLREEMAAAGHPAAVVQDAAYAQCALLDEVALQRLAGADRDAWEREPLQVAEFNTHQAGEELVARIETRLAEPQPVLPLLVVFQTVLGLGFQGRFARDGAGAREALMRALDARLAPADHAADAHAIVVPYARARGLPQASPLAWVVGSLAGAGLVYLALDRWLAASIAQLAG
ncbi:DotU/TssL family secretion system protein [Cupriavidus agavae]|uniref:Type VI secretion system protein ImpK n=1 Tax=Cupriavidus agavae TaxID=1001822 RepID=A0A4Q7RCJ2_9BURK|nr:DotU/TssL family secretion system protein [Cupriavidus agavae]RZT30856.1 type VI secretion system protein ImpK [Cupriavidus agavae]